MFFRIAKIRNVPIEFERSSVFTVRIKCLRVLLRYVPAIRDDFRANSCPETSFVKKKPPRFCHRRVPLDVPTADGILTR